jgi:hypothetical protein
VLDDVRCADMLVLFAINAHFLKRQVTFLRMCAHLQILLPLPEDSELVHHLSLIREAFIVADTVKAAAAARCERGFQSFKVDHYKSFAFD